MSDPRAISFESHFAHVAAIAKARSIIAETHCRWEAGEIEAAEALSTLVAIIFWLDGAPGATFH